MTILIEAPALDLTGWDRVDRPELEPGETTLEGSDDLYEHAVVKAIGLIDNLPRSLAQGVYARRKINRAQYELSAWAYATLILEHEADDLGPRAA